MSVRSAPDIPPAIRAQVRQRDNERCRMCGRTGIPISIHHVIYGGDERGMGGRRVHDPNELICLDAGCHELAHSDKKTWQPLLLLAIQKPGVTAFQLKRWKNRLGARWEDKS